MESLRQSEKHTYGLEYDKAVKFLSDIGVSYNVVIGDFIEEQRRLRREFLHEDIFRVFYSSITKQLDYKKFLKAREKYPRFVSFRYVFYDVSVVLDVEFYDYDAGFGLA